LPAPSRHFSVAPPRLGRQIRPALTVLHIRNRRLSLEDKSNFIEP
jgi:hypothetical protein